MAEILSTSNADYDLRKKKDIYEKHGVQEHNKIEPFGHIVEVHILKEDIFLLDQKVK